MISPTPSYTYPARILRVIDADTYDVEVDLGFRMLCRLPLRLAHVDAPEARTVEGDVATAFVKAMFGALPREVMVKTYKPSDSFGRYLAEVWIGDASVAVTLVQQGHAVPYR